MQKPICLLDLQPQHMATVRELRVPQGSSLDPSLIQRLGELGFLPGETLTVLRKGPGGREPLAVQIGDSIFALRAVEAACVQVDVDAPDNQAQAHGGVRP